MVVDVVLSEVDLVFVIGTAVGVVSGEVSCVVLGLTVVFGLVVVVSCAVVVDGFSVVVGFVSVVFG